MSNVLIGVIAVVLFIGLAIAGALFLGSRFTGSRTEAEAARYLSEGSQIYKAYEMYGIQMGVYPDGDPAKYSSVDATQRKLQQLKDMGFLKSIPVGGSRNGGTAPWYIDDTKGAALTLIGTDDGAVKICDVARRQLGFTDAIKTCDDSTIANNDPCCKAS